MRGVGLRDVVGVGGDAGTGAARRSASGAVALDALQLLASGDGTSDALEFVRRLAFDAAAAAFDAAFATDR